MTENYRAAAKTVGASREAAIVVENISCVYGDYIAVDRVSFSVRAGEIHALLGTNGAGKTTVLESIQGFRGWGGRVRGAYLCSVKTRGEVV